MTQIYNLDHAAGAPLAKTAKKAVLDFINSPLYNTDSSYQPAVNVRRHLADLKSKTAKLLGVNSPNIFITSGSSDATKILFNLVAKSDPTSEVISSEVEHQSLLDQLDNFKSYQILKIQLDNNLINLIDLKKLITDKVILVSIQYVNNETGQVLPIKDIARLINQIKKERYLRNIKRPLFLHTDASQAATTQDLLIPRLGVDAMSLNGSKFGALPNTGLLYLSADMLRWLDKKNIKVAGQKENPLSIISLYHSLEHAISKKNTESKRLASLSTKFWQEFNKQIPEAKLTPKALKIAKKHSAHILNIYIPGISGEKLVILAGLNNILISTGAACSASKDKPSHVLKTLNLSLQEIQSSIRVSFGSDNKSEKEVILAAQKLAQLCQNKAVRL